jgi:hypothetical protein
LRRRAGAPLARRDRGLDADEQRVSPWLLIARQLIGALLLVIGCSLATAAVLVRVRDF